MSIVIITIPGEAKRIFANSLHKLTDGNVELVIIQRRNIRHNSLFNRLKRLYKSVGLRALSIEIWHAILLRLNGEREVLEYFRERNDDRDADDDGGYIPNVLEVESVNSNEVHAILRELSPRLMVIWGSTIIKPHIIKTAGCAINLHMGLCPYYRGAIANQHALMRRELDKIGATIHYAEAEVDSGEILMTLKADTSKKPREMFRDLNTRAENAYLDVAHRLFLDQSLKSEPQDIRNSENFLLKNWTPRVRYNLARQIMEWERTGSI